MEGSAEVSYKKNDKKRSDSSSDDDIIPPKKGLGVPPTGNKARV